MSQTATFTPRQARGTTNKPKLVRLTAASRSRRPLLAAGCVALVVGSTAVVTSAFNHVRGHAEVLVARHAISPGDVIQSDDLTTASISGSGTMSAISPRHESQIVGRTAAVGLVAGEVIAKGIATSGPIIASGQAIVGMSLTVDQLPAGGVIPGQSVQVIVVSPPGSPASGAVQAMTNSASTNNPFATATPSPGGLPGPGTVIVAQALVSKATLPPANSAANFAQDVSLEVPSALAAQIVTLAAAKQIGLALLPSTPGVAP